MKFIKEKKGVIISSIIMIIAGITLLFYPEMTTNTLAYCIAAVFVVMGIVNIVGYLKNSKDEINSYPYGIVVGGILIIFAILIGRVLLSLIPIILGFIVLYSGLMKLQQGIELVRGQYDGWAPIMIMSGINIVLGCLAIFNPFDTVNFLLRIVGVGLLVGGCTDLVSSGYVMNKTGGDSKNEIVVQGIDVEDKE